MPTVSILMPVRDAAATLDACLESVVAQTFADFEFLVIDDHSRDASAALLAAAATADERVRVVTNPGRGLVDALNAGVALARGEFVARMDADDIMMPQRILEQVRVMREQPQVGVVGCQVEQFPAPTRGAELYLEWQNACITPAQIAADIYVEAPFAHPSVMLRRTVLQSHDGYREGDFPEDYDLWLRLHAAGVQMAKVPRVLLRWRDTPGRLTRTDSRYNREAFDRLRAGYLADDPRFRSNASRFVICGAGRRTRQRCRHLLNRGFTPVAWVDIDPRKIGNRLSGVPVVAPQWLEDNRCFALGYVAVHGGRERLARQLDGFGYRRGHDYLLVG